RPEFFPPRSDDFQVFLPDRVTPYPEEQRPLTRAVRGEEVDEAEVFVRHGKAPQGRWVSVTARPMADARCGVRGGILVCRDITSRKRAETRQATQYAVTRALEESADLESGGPAILRHVCEGLGWDVGFLWVADDATRVLR